jgi:integrase
MARGRPRDVRHWASKGGYCTTWHGKKVVLAKGPKDEPNGPTYLAAWDEYKRLWALEAAGTAADRNTVEVVCIKYAEHLEFMKQDRSLALFEAAAEPFVEANRETLIRDLRAFHLADHLANLARPRVEGQTKISGRANNTLRLVREQIRAAFSWAKASRLIDTNPFADPKSVPAPEATYRGPESAITAPQHAALLGTVRRATRPLLTFLWLTGARPGEGRHLTAGHLHLAEGWAIYPAHPRPGEYRHKTARKTKRDRVIYLPPEIRPTLADLAVAHPTGPLFLTQRGTPWTLGSLSRAVRMGRERVGLPEAIVPYSYRHGFITRKIANGMPIKVLADAVGTSAIMIDKVYCHSHDDKPAMLAAVLRYPD